MKKYRVAVYAFVLCVCFFAVRQLAALLPLPVGIILRFSGAYMLVFAPCMLLGISKRELLQAGVFGVLLPFIVLVFAGQGMAAFGSLPGLGIEAVAGIAAYNYAHTRDAAFTIFIMAMMVLVTFWAAMAG